MFKRKNGVLAFLLVAVMLLGVGFAALTDTLTVTGSATATIEGADTPANKEFDGQICFANAVATDAAKNVTAVIDTDTMDTLTVTVPAGVLGVKGNKTTVSVDIKNDSTHDVTVTLNNTETTDFSVTSVSGTSNSVAIAAGQSAPVTVTVELINNLTDDSGVQTFNVTYSVTTG